MKVRLCIGMLLIIVSMTSVGDYRIPLENQDRYILSQRMAYLETRLTP